MTTKPWKGKGPQNALELSKGVLSVIFKMSVIESVSGRVPRKDSEDAKQIKRGEQA